MIFIIEKTTSFLFMIKIVFFLIIAILQIRR
jgi:hypothetical protein